MFDNILIVCVGNICRSPMAEYMLKARLRLKENPTEVNSAGVAAQVASPIEKHAGILLSREGIDASEHRARQVSAEQLRSADLVLTMEEGHTQFLLNLAPEIRGKVYLLGHWHEKEAVQDPYRQSPAVFTDVYRKISRHIDSWVPLLRE
jgi:protein-tyrosine phosphatase